MGVIPRARAVNRGAAEDFVGPPEPGLFDRFKQFATDKFAKLSRPFDTGFSAEVDTFRSAGKVAALPVVATKKVAVAASDFTKKFAVVAVLALFVFLFVYAFAGQLAQRVTSR